MLALAPIISAIEQRGLAARGAFALDEVEPQAGVDGVEAIVLVGAVGARGWRAFADSPEARDGLAHPLDRWSRRVIGALAHALGAKALFPFDGPPHWPFQRWAMRAEAVRVSPLGLLIHPDHGLWHSYRGALAFAEAIAVPERAARANPCETCSARACLGACPAGAFAVQSYDVDACAGHLRQEAGRVCMDGGCLARRACPVGARHAHESAQARFHMRAFLNAREARQ
ncbi:MAG: hypothetical protein ACLPGW_02510 [Roseiarcus sp.]